MLIVFIFFGIITISSLITPIKNGRIKEIAIICALISIGLYYGIRFAQGEPAWSPLNSLEEWMINSTPFNYNA
ncbi:MAG: hypothetical protein LBD85_00865 [Oscillospiraceae bacterium]|jgi:hypothetical protein|nr:hypothetical protein [Oscillospiraceae bacterium]